MRPIPETHASAEAAFASLGVAKRVSKRHVRQACKRIAKAVDTLVPGGSTDNVLFNLFNNTECPRIFTKSVRAVQLRDSEKICMFADVYNVPTTLLDELLRLCASAGVRVRAFEKHYPGTCFEPSFKPPKQSIMSSGYDQLYRGKLFGIVVDA